MPRIAAGLTRRWKAKAEACFNAVLNIILCENLHDAPDLLRAYVGTALGSSYRAELQELVGFVPAVIARMSPVPTPEQRALDLSLITAEPYKVLPVDKQAFVGSIPSISGMKAVSPFAAYPERKLYIHNASHAILGYLGYLRGYSYGYEALEDHWVRKNVEQALDEAGRALIAEHDFEPVAFQEHVDYLLLRFSNQVLADPVERLARDVLRKLAPTDRVVGAARLAEKHGIKPQGLSFGIAAALSYDNPADVHAVELQKLLAEGGFFAVLREICGLEEGEQLSQLVYSCYLELKAWEQKLR